MKNILNIYIFFIVLSFSIKAADKQIKVGIDEQLGKKFLLQEYFVDENGNKVLLNDLITKPTVLAFVYYHCTAICSPLLMELASTIDKSDLVAGVDYNIVCISIDEFETPKDAAQKKQTFFSAIDKNIPPESWKFLTGDSATIKKVADVAGFYFKRQGKDFIHTGAFIFVDKAGKICRYLFPGYSERSGFGILPFDFKMAVIETSEGKISPTIGKILQFCFSYDAKGKTYVMNLTRIFGAVILLLIVIFIFYLRLKPKNEFIKTR
jgi:protein SCO1/2